MTTNNDDRDDNNKSTMPTITMTKNNGDAMNIQERTKKRKKFEVCKVHLDDGTRTTTTATIGTTNDKTTHQNFIIHIHLTTAAIRIIATFEIRNKKAASTFRTFSICVYPSHSVEKNNFFWISINQIRIIAIRMQPPCVTTICDNFVKFVDISVFVVFEKSESFDV